MGVTAAILAVALTGGVVFEDASPSCPAWTYHDDGSRLVQDMRTIDGERALCVSNPTNAPGGYLAWSVVSRPFEVKGGCELEVASRLISAAAEFGGGSYGRYRTGVVWLGSDGREVAFKGLNFPSREPQLLTFVNRVAVPDNAVKAQLSYGFGYSNFPTNAIFALSSARARLIAKDRAGEPPHDPYFEATDVPRLERITPSPCENANAEYRLKVTSKHPIDWRSFVCTLDGAVSDRIRREGRELAVRPPEGGWRIPSFPVVRVSGRDERGTRFEDEQTFCFGRKLKKNVVTLRDDGMTLVDGKPFFPIGVYGIRCLKPEDEAVLAKLKAAKFNTVQSYIGGLEDLDFFLSATDRHGLKAILEPAPRNFCKPAEVLETAYALRSHPSLLSWYLGDDSASHQSARHLRKVDEYVKAVDNGHITSQSDSVLWRDLTLSRQTRLVGATDVFIPQLYPAMKAEITGKETPEITRDFLEYRKDLELAGNPVTGIWPALQGFKGYGSWPRYPTAAEQRAQAWLSIVRGARGLLWYLYHANGKGNVGLADDPALWKIVGDVISEVDQYKDDLVTRDAAVQPRVEIMEGGTKDGLGYPAVAALLKEGVGGRLLIAVNSSNHPVKARAVVDGVKDAQTVALGPLDVFIGKFQEQEK